MFLRLAETDDNLNADEVRKILYPSSNKTLDSEHVKMQTETGNAASAVANCSKRKIFRFHSDSVITVYYTMPQCSLLALLALLAKALLILLIINGKFFFILKPRGRSISPKFENLEPSS